MNDFANYDPRMWLDKVFSRHPRKTGDRKALARGNDSQLTQFAITTAAVASLFVMQGFSQLPSVGQQIPVNPSQLSSTVNDPVYWLETTVLPPGSELSAFEARAAAVAQQLLNGSLSNVPTATLDFARAALNRPRLDSAIWIANVAKEMSRLID